MEKFNSAIQLVFAAFIVLFGFGTMIRCIIAGSDFFYIIMFALMGTSDAQCSGFCLKNTRKRNDGDYKRHTNH